jgi:MFS transporter, FSR family, fosmidomycin resistance protein
VNHSAEISSTPWRQDGRTMSVVGLAHGASHFFHLLLPPLFPFFIHDFGLSYSQLGLLVTVFFMVSGCGQTVAGFAVDRFGARPVLVAAFICFTAAAWVAASAHSYSGLMVSAILAGLGNAPLHPADFTILNSRVSPQRLGHAFSVHAIAGNIGWACAPVFLTGVSAATGSWRWAAFLAGLIAIFILSILWLYWQALDDGHKHKRELHLNPSPLTENYKNTAHPFAFLKLPATWLCFSFFFWTTCALCAVQSFAGPALGKLYGLPLSTTTLVVTAYMLCGAAGMVWGGFWISRPAASLERVIAASLIASAGLMCLAGSGLISGMGAWLLVVLAGLGTGIAGPSRDMLIKKMALPGATGRVYGMVYSGLDLGFALAAPVWGYLLDTGQPSAIFFGAASALILSVVSAWCVGIKPRQLAAIPSQTQN